MGTLITISVFALIVYAALKLFSFVAFPLLKLFLFICLLIFVYSLGVVFGLI